MSGSINLGAMAGSNPGLAALVSQGPDAFQSALQNGGLAGILAGNQQPQQPQPAQTAAAQPGASTPQPSQPTPFWSNYLQNIGSFESGNGSQVGNGGGTLQLTKANRDAFNQAYPAFSKLSPTDPNYVKAAFNWLGSKNTSALAANGVNPATPGAFYGAWSLGPAATAALAKADPNADAATVVKNADPSAYEGNKGFFTGNPTAAQLLQNLSGVEKDAKLGNAGAQSGSAPASGGPQAPTGPQAPVGPQAPSGAQSDPGALNQQQISDLLPQTPGLQSQLTGGNLRNNLAAAAAGLLSGHSFADGLGKAFSNVDATRLQETDLANQATQGNFNNQLNRAQALLTIAKMNKYTVVPGTASVDPQTGKVTYMGVNGFGQYVPIDGTGTPLSLVRTAMTQQGADGRTNAMLNIRSQIANQGTTPTGSPTQVTPPAASPPSLASAVGSLNGPPGGGPTGLSGPPQAGPPAAAPPGVVQAAQARLAANGQPPAAPAPAPTQPAPPPPSIPFNANDPVDKATASAAGSYLQMAQSTANPNMAKPIAAAAVKTNSAALSQVMSEANGSTDTIEGAEKALAAIQSNPGALPKDKLDQINNALAPYFGGQPIFAGVTSTGLQLTNAFIKQAGAAQTGDIIHNDMHISRITQGEVTITQPAVTNGQMTPQTVQTLLRAVINNANADRAVGNIMAKMQQSGQFPITSPGIVSTLDQQITQDLWSGKHPDIFTPTVPVNGTNEAPPNIGNPGVPPPPPNPAQPATSGQTATGVSWQFSK